MIEAKSITVGIHRAIHDKVDPELEVYRKILKFNNIRFIELDSSDLDFWEKLNEVTHFFYKWSHSHRDHQIAHAIIPVIQYQLGKKCYPSWETSWHYDDKVKQTFLLREGGFPVVKSYVFFQKSKAIQFLNSADFPMVFKLKNGSGSFNVRLLKSRDEGLRIASKMFGNGISQDQIGFFGVLKTFNYDLVKIVRHYAIFYRNRFFQKHRVSMWWKHKNYLYLQEFLSGNDFDTRVQITGKRAYAYIRYNRPDDFRASGSNNWSLKHENINMEMIRIAFDVSKKFNHQSMAYDFIYDKSGKPVIVEMSYCYGDYPEFSDGYWDDALVWHEGNFVPQYFELCDFLELNDLKQPDDISAGSSYKNVAVKN